jgi:3-oxoacyl-[acyl-carrier protein] reductase
MDLRIQSRRALVLGGTSGLGHAIAVQLAEEGAEVIVVGRRPAEETDLGGVARSYVRADLSQPGCSRSILDAVGDVDILVLNSGGPAPGSASDTGSAELQAAASQLLYELIDLTRGIIPGMISRGWGRVLAVGSSGVTSPISGLAISNTLRAALWGYLKTLAAEVAPHGVTVNMVSPGRIDTDRVRFLDERKAASLGFPVEQVQRESIAAIPMGRYGKPEEFGAVAAFLCSDLAGYVTGLNMRVDGGMERSS